MNFNKILNDLVALQEAERERKNQNTEILLEIAEHIVKTEHQPWDNKGSIIHGLDLANVRLGNAADYRLGKLNLHCRDMQQRELLK